MSPADLPVGPDRMWTRLKGRRVPLKPPEDISTTPALLLGPPGESLPDLCVRARGAHSAWIVETGAALAACSNDATRLSYDKLRAYRMRLMAEVQKIAQKGEVRGPRQLGGKLRTLSPKDAESAGVQAIRRAKPICWVLTLIWKSSTSTSGRRQRSMSSIGVTRRTCSSPRGWTRC